MKNSHQNKSDRKPIEEIYVRRKPPKEVLEGMTETRAVLPELPAPLKPIYIRFRDMNKMRGEFEELKPKPAVEIGVNFTF